MARSTDRRLYLFNKPVRIVKALEGVGGLARRDSDRKRHTRKYRLPGGGFAGLYVVDSEVIDPDNG